MYNDYRAQVNSLNYWESNSLQLKLVPFWDEMTKKRLNSMYTTKRLCIGEFNYTFQLMSKYLGSSGKWYSTFNCHKTAKNRVRDACKPIYNISQAFLGNSSSLWNVITTKKCKSFHLKKALGGTHSHPN